MKYIRCSNEIFQFQNYPLYLKFEIVPKIKFQYGHSEYFDGISAVFTIGYTYQWFQSGVPVTEAKYVYVTTRESKHQIIGEKCLLKDYFDYTKQQLEACELLDEQSLNEEEKERLNAWRATTRPHVSSWLAKIAREKQGALLRLDEVLSIINQYVNEVPTVKTQLELVKKQVSSKTEFWNEIITKLLDKFEKETVNGN